MVLQIILLMKLKAKTCYLFSLLWNQINYSGCEQTD